MRLINVHDRFLKEFFDDEIPRYAILSHTWGEEEVTLRDFEDPKHREKKGHRKIDYCCQEAVKHRLDWVWVDTCCIDKTSSAELSEVINSMFQWYKKSTFCYVYLSDVVHTVDEDMDDASAREITNRESLDALPIRTAVALRKSRWFRRGWTLQELLAPWNIRFFDQEGRSIGSRETLCDLIADITRIPKRTIQFLKPSLDYSAAEVFSWASTRQTTRKEDSAYCLLGLLDINMPLLYGEGDKAFLRLQEELMKRHHDHTLLAWNFSAGLKQRLKWKDSLLAKNPSVFGGDWSGVKMLEEDSHYILTNMGLQIELPVVFYTEPEDTATPGRSYSLAIGLLECGRVEEDGTLRRFAIPLVWQERGGQLAPLARMVPTNPAFLVPKSSSLAQRAQRRLTYINERINISHDSSGKGLSAYVISCFSSSMLVRNDWTYRLQDCFPPMGGIDPPEDHGKQVSLQLLRKFQPKVLLRFACQSDVFPDVVMFCDGATSDPYHYNISLAASPKGKTSWEIAHPDDAVGMVDLSNLNGTMTWSKSLQLPIPDSATRSLKFTVKSNIAAESTQWEEASEFRHLTHIVLNLAVMDEYSGGFITTQ